MRPSADRSKKRSPLFYKIRETARRTANESSNIHHETLKKRQNDRQMSISCPDLCLDFLCKCRSFYRMDPDLRAKIQARERVATATTAAGRAAVWKFPWNRMTNERPQTRARSASHLSVTGRVDWPPNDFQRRDWLRAADGFKGGRLDLSKLMSNIRFADRFSCDVILSFSVKPWRGLSWKTKVA